MFAYQSSKQQVSFLKNSLNNSDSLKRGGFFNLKTKKAVICLVIITAMFSSFAALSSQMCYAVSVNGEYVGTVTEKRDAVDIINNIDQSVKKLQGDNTSAADQVDVSASFSFGNLPLNILRNKIINNLSGIVECWYLSVDGEPVARADSREELQGVLDKIVSLYASGEDVYADFNQNTLIAYGLVSEKLESDLDAVYEMLLPGSESGVSLDVRTIESEYTYSEVPYETIDEESDQYYPEETGTVMVRGENGITQIKTETISVNGEQVSQTVSQQVVQSPVNEVLAIGTREYAYESTGEFIWPTQGNITSYFGYRNVSVGSSNHKGLDIAGSYGQDIKAVDGGTVIYADWMNGYGYLVQVQHDNGDVTYYAHCSQLNVSVGDRVYQGQVISQMGNTGVSSGVHVHFEVRVDGKTAVDPLSYLPS